MVSLTLPVLKPCVLLLGRNQWARKGLLELYHWQLRLIVAMVSREKAVMAIILRRGAVLEDAHPGDSDYDLTWIIDSTSEPLSSALIRCGRLHRLLKSLFPVLGETKFVDRRDFATHLQHDWPSYGGAPLCLYRRRNIGPLPAFGHVTSATARIAGVLQESLLPRVYGLRPSYRGKAFMRSFAKDLLKVEWLMRTSKGERTKLSYAGKLPMNQCYLSEKEAERRLLRLISTLPACVPPTKVCAVRVVGEVEKLPPSLLLEVREAVGPLLERVEELALVNFRPYQFQKTLVARVGAEWGTEELKAALKGVAKRLRGCSYAFSPNIVLPYSERGWKFILASDAIGQLCYRSGRYDFVRGAYARGERDGAISRRSVEKNLSETLVLLYSVLRREDTNYLLDLFFGQLIPYRLILQQNVFYSTFAEFKRAYLPHTRMEAELEEWLHWYENGNRSKLDALPTAYAWKRLAPLILPEISAARRELARE